MNAPEHWLQRVYSLSERFSWCGLHPDLACMSLADLWGVYCHLSRIADGG